MTSIPAKPDENRSKRKKEAKNEASEKPPLPSLEKKDVSFSDGSTLHQKTEALETALNDTSKEINAFLLKYAHILSEKAAMDTSYVEELEEILKEASSIEHHLKVKRENVRHRFASIAGPLQRENGSSGK